MVNGSTTINLISNTYTYDDIGNSIVSESVKRVYADIVPISQSEFFNAQTTGLKPEYEFLINGLDYEGEKLVEFNGKKYTIYRYYLRADEMCELYCEERIGNG